jgi:hypothetical protein
MLSKEVLCPTEWSSTGTGDVDKLAKEVLGRRGVSSVDTDGNRTGPLLI